MSNIEDEDICEHGVNVKFCEKCERKRTDGQPMTNKQRSLADKIEAQRLKNREGITKLTEAGGVMQPDVIQKVGLQTLVDTLYPVGTTERYQFDLAFERMLWEKVLEPAIENMEAIIARSKLHIPGQPGGLVIPPGAQTN